MKILSVFLRLCGLVILTGIAGAAQIPTPKDVIGFTPGDDRKLASWTSIVDYFKKLDAASDRVIFEEIGKSTMGAPFVFATISSPENLRNLERYKTINAELADPRLMARKRATTGTYARLNIRDGKTIVLITCGIHSTEVGSTLSSMLIAHRLASSNDADVKKILDNTIILLVPSLNPDGVDIVKNWYDKTLGTKFEGTSPPELYHKYVGHDNNRDWYAFTQVETQLTVDKIHNVWHPQIVHDIHQQGTRGSRLFLPPYMQPVEPNVPKQIVEGYTELGNYMAADLRKKGFQGITTNSSYDAWTPARAYSHYHGGVRILSETASARLATPITVTFEDSKSDARRSDDETAEAVTLTDFAKVESANFGPVWKGGEWKLRNITDYMTTAAFSLLNHAADNRERWLSRFYEIGKEAVRSRKVGEAWAYLIAAPEDPIYGGKYQDSEQINVRRWTLLRALSRGGVGVELVGKFSLNGKTYRDYTAVVRLDQPYAGFAKALIEPVQYPNLFDSQGNPLPPYDVTAHSLAELSGTKVDLINRTFTFPKAPKSGANADGVSAMDILPVLVYRSHMPSMDEGWTRWIFDQYPIDIAKHVFGKFRYLSVRNDDIHSPDLLKKGRIVVFPDQSPSQILNGYAKGTMPDEYTGGVGKEGVENLRNYVENGGTLVFLNRSSNFAIEQFNLPVKDVTRGLNRKDFFIPGSILRTELDTTHPIAKGMPQRSIAWFENSPVFEIQTDPLALSVPPASAGGSAAGLTRNFRIIATYPKDPKQILLSGWALGAEKIAGKAALVEFTIGKGKIVLFGFRPQYRGQSLATFPLLFNSIAQ